MMKDAFCQCVRIVHIGVCYRVAVLASIGRQCQIARKRSFIQCMQKGIAIDSNIVLFRHPGRTVESSALCSLWSAAAQFRRDSEAASLPHMRCIISRPGCTTSHALQSTCAIEKIHEHHSHSHILYKTPRLIRLLQTRSKTSRTLNPSPVPHTEPPHFTCPVPTHALGVDLCSLPAFLPGLNSLLSSAQTRHQYSSQLASDPSPQHAQCHRRPQHRSRNGSSLCPTTLVRWRKGLRSGRSILRGWGGIGRICGCGVVRSHQVFNHLSSPFFLPIRIDRLTLHTPKCPFLPI